MKYAIFDESGLPVAFYSEDVHGDRMRPVYGEVPEPTEEDPEPVAPVTGEEPNPECTIPADSIKITDEQWVEFLMNPGRRRWSDGAVSPYEPPAHAPTVEDYRVSIQVLIDQTAASKQFNDGVTLASYANSTNPAWKQQSLDFVAWRDQVWAFVYEQLALVQAGERAQPTVADFLTELPVITWSAAL